MADKILPARIEAEYKDMVISQLKEEIFELRKNQVHLDKLSTMVETLETKCRGFEREKVKPFLGRIVFVQTMKTT